MTRDRLWRRKQHFKKSLKRLEIKRIMNKRRLGFHNKQLCPYCQKAYKVKVEQAKLTEEQNKEFELWQAVSVKAIYELEKELDDENTPIA